MALIRALADKLNAALQPQPSRLLTVRDAKLPQVPGKGHAIIGMRRAGKTCYLHQLLSARRAMEPAHQRAIYLSFDDDRLAGLGTEQLDELLEEYFRRHPAFRSSGRVAWFLDEIQLVNGWDRFVRRVMDTENIDMVVSGSSAKMLSREVHSSLRGRAMATVIRPFGFREYLRHRNLEPSGPAGQLPPNERSSIEQNLMDYLVAGGFPECQGLNRPERIALLQSYVDTVMLRDILERHEISQVAALRWIIRHALRNPCGSFSVHRLHEDLRSQGYAIAKDSVHAMLDHLTDAFLISTAWISTESERQRNSNPRKVYPADVGLIEAFDASGRSNIGHALETAVFNELERRGADVSYVKLDSDREVDFLVTYPGGPSRLIQVCADPSEPETLAREVTALNEAHKLHPRSGPQLVVLAASVAARTQVPGIEVIPAAEWLLDLPV